MNNDMIQRSIVGNHLGSWGDGVITTEGTRLRRVKVYAIPFLKASKG